MKIAFVSSEAAPFCKTGGLGDVASALPLQLSKIKGNEVILFLPYYNTVKNNPKFECEFIKSFYVELGWRKQHVGVFKLKSRKKKLSVYFLDNEYYFNRGSYYSQGDDGERFAYFSMAVLESVCQLNLSPDVIHCNDWQTALIPLLLHAKYQCALPNTKTVFTIHNIEYQGKCDRLFIGDVLGLDSGYENTLCYDGMVNFMKSAVLSCDALTTVSRSYAEEIKYPFFSHGLFGVIDEHSFKLSGIVNGIDTDLFNPVTDKSIFRNYGTSDFTEGKAINKQELQNELHLPVRGDVPMIGLVTRLAGHKGMDIFCYALSELCRWDIQLVILGTGEQEFENCIRYYADKHPDKISANIFFDGGLANRIYASADAFLMPSKSEPCGLSQMIAMRYGTVPIVHSVGGLKDTVTAFNPESGNGLGFTFQSYTMDDMIDAIRRTLTLFGCDKAKWKRLVKNDMNGDFSWKKSAEEYMSLYNKILD